MIKWIVIFFIIALVAVTPIIVAIVLAAEDPEDDFEAEYREFQNWYEDYKKRKKK